jgi:hypothetical protein
MRIFKKGSGKASVTYSEALARALCYGGETPADDLAMMDRGKKFHQ